MIPAMLVSRFCQKLADCCNDALSMSLLLRPFGLEVRNSACYNSSYNSSEPSDYLLVGHLLDELAVQKNPSDTIDPIDVAALAYELGFDPAGDFLDESPFLLLREDAQSRQGAAGRF